MKAQQELIRLDIGRNPSAYVQLAAALDARGRVIVALANPTSLPLTGFGVDYAWVDDNGRTRTDSFFLTATLPPGEQITRRLNLGMTNVTRLDTRFRAEVKSASVLEPGS